MLTQATLGGVPIWVPAALLVLLPLIYLAVRLLLGCAVRLVTFVARRRKRAVPTWLSVGWDALSKPTAFLLTVVLHGSVGSQIGIPISHRHLFSSTVTVLFLGGLVWWLWRLQDLLAGRIRAYLEATNPGHAQSVYVIGRRALRGLTLTVAILIALAVFGVELSATLAGLGIGGLALALAAQKTLENVFGGISVLSDQSIVVGNNYQIGTYVGTVEDVGLRTTKLRTLARTVVHVPNGSLAIMDVENLSRRDKFLVQTILALRYETTREQLAAVLASLRQLLAADSRVERDTLRVRFVRFGPYSLEVEVFAYLLVPDYPQFLAVQEEILLRVMQLVSQAGTAFAIPVQAPPSSREAGVRS